MQFYKHPLWSVINHAALAGGVCPLQVATLTLTMMMMAMMMMTMAQLWWHWADWWVNVITRCPHCHSCRWWWWWRWWTTESIFLRSHLPHPILLPLGGTLSGALFFSLLPWKFTLLSEWTTSTEEGVLVICHLLSAVWPAHLPVCSLIICRQMRLQTFNIKLTGSYYSSYKEGNPVIYTGYNFNDSPH